MRKKLTGGGKARLACLPPYPSAKAIRFLRQLTDSEAQLDSDRSDIQDNEANNDGQCSTVAEISSDSDDNRRCPELVPSTTGETVVLAENSHGLDPEEMHGPDYNQDDILDNEANNDGQWSTIAATSGDSDHNRRCHKLAPNTTVETVVLAENSCGLDPQEIHGPEDCLEMDWTETEVCIKCAKGGKLLVCTDSNCPLAVHEECMHCSARFDSTGNFYCPYCAYKRSMLETREARKKVMLAKKALSDFLDKRMMDGHPQKPKVERHMRKETNPSTAVGDAEVDDNRNRLDGDEADCHFFPIEEDQREETFDLCKGAKALAVNEQNDVLSRCGHSARPDNGTQQKVVIEEPTQTVPIIACGSDGTCREEETILQFEIAQVDKGVQAEHPKLLDDHQNERLLQNEQQPGPLGASLVEKEPELDAAVHISTAGELDSADVVKEHEGSRPEAEVMQDQEKGTTLSSCGDDFMQQEPLEDSDLSHGDNGNGSPHRRRLKRKKQNGQSPSVDNPRKSARNLSKPNAKLVQKKEKNATPKSMLQEAEVMQDQENEPILSSSGDDFMEQEPLEDSDLSHGYNGNGSPHWRRGKRKNQNGIQSPSVDSPRRSEPKAKVVQKKKNNATSKSRLRSPTFPNARRKKVPWTADEEEMLKEGVQKFSTMVNKNVPWRKILEFGHHVFHGTRTPVDLKDKWRNILVK